MSDTYGTIVVGFSKDFKGNKLLLVEALNVFEFTNDGSKFLLDKSGEHICLNSRSAQYPLLFPSHSPTAYFFEKNSDNVVIKKWEDVDEEDEELFCDYICEQIELSDIAMRLSKCIDKGSVYISSASTQKAIYTNHSNLQVNSNGTAKRHMHSQIVGEQPKVIFEQV